MIIKDRTYLDEKYCPENLKFREEETKRIIYELNEFRSIAGNLDIIGPTGTGKTVTILKVISELNYPPLNKVVYTNCRDNPTSTKAFVDIVRKLSGDLSVSYYNAMNIYDMALQSRKPIIVLDEIDMLLENDKDAVLYWLSNRDVSVVNISNDPRWRDLIDDTRIESRMPSNPLEFPPYTIPQIYDILSERVALALYPNRIDSKRMQTISVIAGSETGDIRHALSLLYTSAKIAEMAQKEKISDEDIIIAKERLHGDQRVTRYIHILPDVKKLLLVVIFDFYKATHSDPTAEEICRGYNKEIQDSKYFRPLTLGTIKVYLKELMTYRLISSQKTENRRITRGRKEYVYSLTISNDLFEEKIYNEFKKK